MGEKVYGHHAIEEAIKKAGMGSTLYIERTKADKLGSKPSVRHIRTDGFLFHTRLGNPCIRDTGTRHPIVFLL